MRDLSRLIAFSILLLTGLLVLAAPFLAPYSPRQQFREWAYVPPTRLHLFHPQRGLSWPPFIYDYEPTGSLFEYRRTPRILPLRFLAPSPPYRWLGLTWRVRLLGLQDPEKKLFLMGSDALGRDLFSRFLFGARFSLGVGLAAILITVVWGVGLGTVAGYASGWLDVVITRLTDLFLALPALFLILGVRAVLPVQMSTGELFWVMVLTFSLLGWASLTRVVRGQVLSLKNRPHVLAARALGAGTAAILWRHILPFTFSFVAVQASVYLPAFILGEITLSFLGVGVQEPQPSWGNLLNAAISPGALSRHPWLMIPALQLFLTVLAFNLLSDFRREQKERAWF